MKYNRIFLLTIITLLIVLFSSCEVQDGGVNYNIYPYLKITPSEDNSYCKVSIVDGAKLENINIPSDVVYKDNNLKVKEFLGFENQADSKHLKVITFDSNITTIKEGALDKAEQIERIEIKNHHDDSNTWQSLPNVDKPGYHLVGWKVNDKFVKLNDPIKGGEKITPIYEAHSLKAHHGYDSTCFEEGLRRYYECVICGKYFTDSLGTKLVNPDDLIIPIKEHDLIYHEEVKPDCYKSGNIEYYECKICKLYYTDMECTHQVSNVTLDKLPHIMKYFPYIPPTCEVEGRKEHYKCERCNHYFLDEAGLYEINSTIIPIVPHTYYDEWKYNTNNHYHECIYCHEAFDTAEHTFDEGVITTHPTQTKKGEYTYTCLICDYQKKVDIPEGDHVPIFIERVAPDCINMGYDVFLCEICNEVVHDNYTKALGHDVVEIPYKAPSCHENGVIHHYHCKVCNLNFLNPEDKVPLDSVVIFQLEHECKTVWSSDETHHWHDCYNCEDVIDYDHHEFNQRVIDTYYKAQDANCFESAKYYFSCICGRRGILTFSVGDPLAHNLTHYPKVDPTCDDAGNIEYWYCDRCFKYFADANCENEINKNDTIIPSHHDWTEDYEVDASYHWKVCKICNITSNQEEHDKKYAANDHYHYHICTICGYNFNDAERHNFIYSGNTQYCTICGVTLERTDSPSSFDVEVNNKLPTGYIQTTFNEQTNIWNLTLISTSLLDKYQWYVNDEEQIGATTNRFELTHQYGESYIVLCIFSNENGYSSDCVTIN